MKHSFLRTTSSVTEAMNDKGKVRVLVVGESYPEFLACRQFFTKYDCQCHFAKSHQEVRELLHLWQFDIVLSAQRIPDGSIRGLVALLSGSRASVFYSLRVEEGHWWMPVLRLGKECFGTPAFRAGEFVSVLDRIVKRVEAGLTAPAS
jgi:hypothetical protein